MRPFSLLACCVFSAGAFAQPLPSFKVSWPADKLAEPFSGRVLVYLSKGKEEPRFAPNWLDPQPCFSVFVRGVKPGESVLVDPAKAVAFPKDLSKVAPGAYSVQAVVDRNLGGRSIGESAGNLYSKVGTVTFGTSGDAVSLTCDQVVAEPKFQPSPFCVLVKHKSKLLSDFYGRPTSLQASVWLPLEWSQKPTKKYPAYYSVHGFGGGVEQRSKPAPDMDGIPFIRVFLDANCPTGHSVFADSENNGPWGKALTEELIPAIEKRFRAIGQTKGRFVGGHSSGGWSSLWLQVAYPDFFGGVWSTSPDPIDFTDFQVTNIYSASANVFLNPDGSEHPLAREGDKPILFTRGFSDMERPIRGEQLGSFEAVFSKRGPDGEPEKLWNRETGAVNAKVASDWKRYDIGMILRDRWKQLGPKLRGKLHVYTGDLDTFYLEGPVKKVGAELKALGSDAKFEVLPGNHFTVITPAVQKRIEKEMADRFRDGQK